MLLKKMIPLADRAGIVPARLLASTAQAANVLSYSQILSSSLPSRFDTYADQRPVPICLKDLVNAGRGNKIGLSLLAEGTRETQSESFENEVLLQNAKFLHHELQVRFARAIRKLDEMPLLGDMPSVSTVRRRYWQSFSDLGDFPHPSTVEEERAFAQLTATIAQRHSDTMIYMARGVLEWRRSRLERRLSRTLDCPVKEDPTLAKHGAVLDRFLAQRIGLRLLLAQHNELHSCNIMPTYTGIVCLNTCLGRLLEYAISDAEEVCIRHFQGQVPRVEIEGINPDGLVFPYIPEHLHYMLFELLKNAMRATVERHSTGQTWCEVGPPIKIKVSMSPDSQSMVLTISDQGDGIPKENLEHIWRYMFTTASSLAQDTLMASSDALEQSTPLAGLGYGLPLSRLYARYFGGDLRIVSKEGEGVDAMIMLRQDQTSSYWSWEHEHAER